MYAPQSVSADTPCTAGASSANDSCVRACVRMVRCAQLLPLVVRWRCGSSLVRARMHARMHARARPRTHACTHTHTHAHATITAECCTRVPVARGWPHQWHPRVHV